MSVGQDIVGDVFRADMASVGGVTGSGPYTYTEQYPGTLLGTNATATVDSVATVNGVTTLTATISNSSVFNGELTATLVGNDATDFLVNGNFPVLGNSYVYFTNDAAQQPGVDQTTTVAPESADIVYTPVCFTTGTSILTERGPVAVEHLEVGELVVTAWGARRPITWIGRRTIDCRRHPRQAEVMPIRITAHAFGASRPARELYVSPGHSICVDIMGETLIPASALVNGSTIAQVEVENVTYWHVELDDHDIIIAENLACESYLEMGNRAFFVGDVVALQAGPDEQVRTHADFCRPFVAEGPLLEVAKTRLQQRADRLAAASDFVTDTIRQNADLKPRFSARA